MGDLTFHRCPELGQDNWTFQPCVDQALGAGPLGKYPEGGDFLSGGSPGGVRVMGWCCPRAGDDPLIPGGGVWGPNLVNHEEDLAVALRGTGDAGRSEKKSDRLEAQGNHSGCWRKLWVVRPQGGTEHISRVGRG